MMFPAVTICSTGIIQNSEAPVPSKEMERCSALGGDDLSLMANMDMRLRNLLLSLKDFDDLNHLRNVTPQGENMFIRKYIASCKYIFTEYCLK